MTSSSVHLPPTGSVFDTDTNCSLLSCPLDRSIYTYRPSLGANVTFIVLFSLSMAIHVFQGMKWRTWWYSGCMTLGCICEVIGYGGRVMVWQNPFSFTGFLLQIICITIAPAFYTAAIYLTLSQVILYLGREYGRFPPRLYLYIFIPCDIIALSLQGTGGGMSSSSNSNSSAQTGVDISIAGLSFQVATLSIFVIMAADYFFRYMRGRDKVTSALLWTNRFRVFLCFLVSAIVLIFIRCAFRINELKDGYDGGSFHQQGTFIGLESVMIVLATFSLNLAHPGPVFLSPSETQPIDPESGKGEGN